jgi:hypothetical protein
VHNHEPYFFLVSAGEIDAGAEAEAVGDVGG